jgi:hypothetical protein
MKSEVYDAELILVSHFDLDQDCAEAQKIARSIMANRGGIAD